MRLGAVRERLLAVTAAAQGASGVWGGGGIWGVCVGGGGGGGGMCVCVCVCVYVCVPLLPPLPLISFLLHFHYPFFFLSSPPFHPPFYFPPQVPPHLSQAPHQAGAVLQPYEAIQVGLYYDQTPAKRCKWCCVMLWVCCGMWNVEWSVQCIHTYMCTYIHVYIQTCVHTHIHTYTNTQ